MTKPTGIRIRRLANLDKATDALFGEGLIFHPDDHARFKAALDASLKEAAQDLHDAFSPTEEPPAGGPFDSVARNDRPMTYEETRARVAFLRSEKMRVDLAKTLGISPDAIQILPASETIRPTDKTHDDRLKRAIAQQEERRILGLAKDVKDQAERIRKAEERGFQMGKQAAQHIVDEVFGRWTLCCVSDDLAEVRARIEAMKFGG